MIVLYRQEKLHELLATEARYKWTDMSKVSINLQKSYVQRMMERAVAVPLIDTRCSVSLTLMARQGLIKKNLRGLLFTYAIPLRANEFEQLWSR